MFFFEPTFVISALLTGLIIFGPISAVIGSKRKVGATSGFFLGFLLGIIGLIIVLCSNKVQYEQPVYESKADELKKYKDLLDSGAINEYEYNVQKARLLE